ncbi:MAG TPA: rhodanese-like domain-containing protein [Cytophagales bacterium]|jgi:rhodanese-related sulfurtransferase/DNA-directed RNA polymerase subunit RPC12/RpoP
MHAINHLLILLTLLLVKLPASPVATPGSDAHPEPRYVCTPCGNDCDAEVYEKPGNCRHCGMALVQKDKVAFTNVSPDELCRLVAGNKNLVLLDVRTPQEYNGQDRGRYGHLKNAINIPIGELEGRIGELNAYKDREIVVYCSHSQRSPRASQLLADKGFTRVRNMSGGLSTWHDSVKDAGCRTGLLVKQ